MEKDLVDGKEIDVKLEIAGGFITVKGEHVGHGGHAKVELAVDSDYLIDKIKEKIPGKVDDAILDVIKVALKAL